MNETAALGDRICELAAHLNAANCRLLELIAEFDAREGWGADGCNSCAHWLNWKCGVGLNAAREKVRVVKALAELPLIHASFSKGAISYSKVRAMSRVATPMNEDYLLMIATHGTAAHVESVVRGYRRAKADLELEEANHRHERRALNWHYDDDGMLVVHARLAPEDGARFIDAVERAAKALETGRRHDETSSARVPFESARADALLHAVAERADTEVQVHVSAETLLDFDSDGCCHLHDGPNLAPHTLRRLACDAGIVRIAEDGKGQPLDVGRRTRTIPPALKRALAARDKGCRFPGCAATRHLHGHHIAHWADGGATALDNLVQLCPHHHRLVHEGGFMVSVFDEDPSGASALRFRRPDGTLIKHVAPRLLVENCAEKSLKRCNARRGLIIGPTTAHPNWDGAPMDRAMAVDAMFSASGDFEKRRADVTAETSAHD